VAFITSAAAAVKDVLRLRQLRRIGQPADFIFGNGTPMDARYLMERFAVAASECEITGHSMYDCRHTFASVLYQRCKDIVYVSKMLGHESPTTTLSYYAHFVVNDARAYIDLLDEPGIGSDLAVARLATSENAEKVN
jgi:integrase